MSSALSDDERTRTQRGLALLLRPFARVEPGEVTSLLLLTFNVFLLMTAYYLLKVVREPLILTGGGAEVKSYASAAQVFLLVGVVRAYDLICKQCCRMRLIATINLFFISNLLVFVVLGKLGVPIGVPFFLWVGIFNVTAIAQFWGMANDVYSPDQGIRLFAVIGVGSSLGAVLGAQIARWAFVFLGPHGLMLLSAGVLSLHLLLAWLVDRRERPPSTEPAAMPEPVGGRNAAQLVLKDHYLLLLALLTLLLNWVNTTGEYILDRKLLEHAQAAVRADPTGTVTISAYIGAFRGQFFSWVNTVGVLLQLFMVSRVMRHLGVRVALFITPVVALAGYSAMAVLPVLSLVAVAKVAENSFGYSLQATVRQALFLVTSREAKFKAKTLIDTFFWRAGDVMAAGLVWLGSMLALSTQGFVWTNIGLNGVWLLVIVGVARLHRQRSATFDGGDPSGDSGKWKAPVLPRPAAVER